MTNTQLYSQISQLPERLIAEVEDFVAFLLHKSSKKKQKITPQFGSAKGKIKMSPDFDAPLDDFKE